MLCKFCGINEINGFKAHIFSDAIIRSCLNIKNETSPKRGGDEAGYILGRNEKYFSGNAYCKTHDCNENPQSDEDIEKTKKHLCISTDLNCYNCDTKLFSRIEGEFITKVYSQLILKDNNTFEYDENAYFITFLMLLINIWRASASKFQNWNLEFQDEENIRKYLFEKILCEKCEIKEIIKKAKDNYESVSKYSFILCFLHQENIDPNDNLIIIDTISNPYYFHVNRLTFFFSTNGFNTINAPFGLQNCYSKEEMLDVLQYGKDKLKVIEIQEDKTTIWQNYFFNKNAKDLLSESKMLLISKLGKIQQPDANNIYAFWEKEIQEKSPNDYLNFTESIIIHYSL